MATVKQIRKRLKDFPQDLDLVVMVDGQYYDINVSCLRRLHVVQERDWANTVCYGIADEDSEESFEVLAIE